MADGDRPEGAGQRQPAADDATWEKTSSEAKAATPYPVARVERGRFAPGYQGPGRGRGARDKLSKRVLEMLLDDFNAHGAEAIARCRKESPAAYLQIMVSLLPKDVQMTHAADGMSEQEIEDEIRRIIAGAAARNDGGKLIEVGPVRQGDD